MSCACENKKLGQELERIRRLAKSLARMEDADVGIFRNADGTYGFAKAANIDKPIIEYISPY